MADPGLHYQDEQAEITKVGQWFTYEDGLKVRVVKLARFTASLRTAG